MQPEDAVVAILGDHPYATLVAEIRDFAILIIDPQANIASWNEGAQLIFGYEKEEIVGQAFETLFVSEDREDGISQAELNTAQTQGRAENTRWHLRKDGTRFWANGVTTALHDEVGQLRGFAKIVRDDTPHKQKEDALHQSQERFDLLARATNDVIWDWNLQTESVWWNNNIETIFGYALERVDSSPDWWKERVHPDDHHQVVETIHHAIDSGGQVWSSEYRFARADGSFAHVFDRGYVHHDAAGQAVRILGAMTDISQRRILEEERQIFERLAHNSPDFIGISDLHGTPIYTNPAAWRLVGLEDNEAAKRLHVTDFFFPEDRDFIRHEFFPRVMREGEGSTEIRFRHFQTNAPLWMNYTVFVVRDTQRHPIALATVSRDISARRQSEAEREELLQTLEFERGRLKDIFEKAPAFVAVLRGPQYVFEMVNPAYYQLVNHRNVIGKPLLEAFPELQGQGTGGRTFPDILNEVVRTTQPYEALEVPVQLQLQPNAPLEERFLNLTYQPLRDVDGAISGVVSHGVDVTEQVRARRTVEDANRVKDEFLATLSHELRTPLTAILGWANILQGEMSSPQEIAKAASVIERNARVQSQLIEDILDVSRVITGKLRLEVQPVDLAVIIEEAVSTVLPAAQAKEIRLQRVIDPGSSIVSGDPARLQQIIWNLLSNAIKFTPKGGRVQIRLERVNSHLEIVVEDTGIGITPDVLPHVFERFRQADSSSTRSHGGLGLGLAIVRHLAELHGGSAEAYSAGLGQGAVFTIKLPLIAVRPLARRESDKEDRVHPTSKQQRAEGELPRLDGLHVVLVDDQEDTRIFLSVVLKKCGAQVTAVASAPEALEAIQQLHPDILLSDIGMPTEDGYSLIKQVRALPPEQGGQTPAAALTAFARVEDRVKVLRSGFQIHLPKPVEPLELATVVANLAGRHSGA